MKTQLALALVTALPLLAQTPPKPPVAPPPPDTRAAGREFGKSVRTVVEQAVSDALRSVDATDPLASDLAQRIHEAVERDVQRIVVSQVSPKGNTSRSTTTSQTSSGTVVSPGGHVTWANADPNAVKVTAARRGYGSRPGRVLVVSPKATDAKVLGEIEEDLNIMSRVLEKEVEREVGLDGPSSAMGIVIFGAGDARSPNAIYLDGHGALFTLNVRFPLVAPAAKKEEPKAEKPADSLWDRTKREMFGPRSDAAVHEFLDEGDLLKTWSKSRGAETKYDAVKVDGLKKSLVDALKNASNLRHLKPDDFVTVVAQNAGSGFSDYTMHTGGLGGMPGMPGGGAGGGGGLGGAGGAGGAPGRSGGGGGFSTTSERMVVVVGDHSAGGASRQATLTIRAKKSDIDEFAKGKLTSDEFRKKAQMNLQ